MKNITNKWFTLIELLVSIAILSVIMVSVFTVFFLTSDLNNKTDISRSMQENIKNIVETIAEDVRKNWIVWVADNNIWDICSFWETKSKRWTKICLNSWASYYIAKKTNINTWKRVLDYETECETLWSECTLVKNDWTNVTPLSNSWVEFRNIYFTVWNESLPKVTINFLIQPSFKKGIKKELIEENKLNIETTISKRLY